MKDLINSRLPMPVITLIFSFLPVNSIPVDRPRNKIIWRKGIYIRRRKNTPAYDRFVLYHSEEEGRYSIMREYVNFITDLRWRKPHYKGWHINIDDFFSGGETTEIRKKIEDYYINECGVTPRAFNGTAFMRKLCDLENCLPRKLNICDRQERYSLYVSEEKIRSEIIYETKKNFWNIRNMERVEYKRLHKLEKRNARILRRAMKRAMREQIMLYELCQKVLKKMHNKTMARQKNRTVSEHRQIESYKFLEEKGPIIQSKEWQHQFWHSKRMRHK